MHIEAELDEIHAERLLRLQKRVGWVEALCAETQRLATFLLGFRYASSQPTRCFL